MARKLYFLIIAFLLGSLPLMANADNQNRGLFAFVYGSNVQVSWRMRATDAPFTTQYLLYADGTLVGTYTKVTTVQLAAATYQNATFSLVVKDKDGNQIDSQSGVKVKANPYVDIPLTAPYIKDTQADTVVISYTPGDCSAYDMDGDGEQEIILKWMPEGGTKCIDSRIYTAHAFYDCYKLDGTRMWRIDAGQNSTAGNNAAFFCWDFDGDGIGEMILKTAPGTKDALGNYCGSAAKSNTGENLPGYDDIEKTYRRGSDGLPTYGVWTASNGTLSVVDGAKSYEWCTVFKGTTGEELGSCDYWPYFNIQSNWYPGGSDGAGYGRRGCSQKGGVMKIPCIDGQTRPCAFFQRGAYTYVYGTCFSWNGTVLTEECRHSSTAVTGTTACSSTTRNGVTTTQDISLYAQGAHPSEVADLDGDGYDECCIGAAAIDHDGTVLWSTGLGHGDAVHVGDLDPDNPGLEVWRITEEKTTYDACMIDGKTGTVLNGQLLTGGDVGRGCAMDIDSTYVGSEYVHNSSVYFYDCKGNQLYKKNFTQNTGYPNYRIFWDGDLLDEHLSDECVSKFVVYGDTVASNYRCAAPGSGTAMLYKLWPVSSINGTKGTPCLQCDLFGDWREELVMFTIGANTTTTSADGSTDYALRILTTTFTTDKKLPWLRDDNTYNMEIACQNIGYSMPPHLGYNAVQYYKDLSAPESEPEPFAIDTEKYYYFQPDGTHYLNPASISSGIMSLSTIPCCVRFETTDTENAYRIKTVPGAYVCDSGNYGYKTSSKQSAATLYTAIVSSDNTVAFQSNSTTEGNIYMALRGTTGVTRAATACYFTLTGYYPGDVNTDGKRNMTDLKILANMLVGKASANPFADVNADGKVDIADLSRLIEYLLK